MLLVLDLIKRKTIFRNKEKTGAEAMEWCKQNALDTNAAFKKLFPGTQVAYTEPEEIFPEEFQYAQQKAEGTPFKMGGRGNIGLLYNVCEQVQAKFAAETGVAYGWSSLSILLSLAKRPGSILVSTDMPYAKMGNDDFVGIVVPPQLKEHWRLIREADISGLPKAFKHVQYLDVVHYDSDKSYLGRMTTYPKLYKKLRSGGIFISDDIQDNLAFKHFCEELNITPIVITFRNQFVGVFTKQ
jgi:predicted O-methyltransferase YrrM